VLFQQQLGDRASYRADAASRASNQDRIRHVFPPMRSVNRKTALLSADFRPTAYALSTTITSEFIHRGRSSPVCLPPYLGRWFHNLCGSPERTWINAIWMQRQHLLV